MTVLARRTSIVDPNPVAAGWSEPVLGGEAPGSPAADRGGRLPVGVCAAVILGSSTALWWGAVQLVRLLLP